MKLPEGISAILGPAYDGRLQVTVTIGVTKECWRKGCSHPVWDEGHDPFCSSACYMIVLLQCNRCRELAVREFNWQFCSMLCTHEIALFMYSEWKTEQAYEIYQEKLAKARRKL